MISEGFPQTCIKSRINNTAKKTTFFDLEHLPIEVSAHIFCYFTLPELSRVLTVSKLFYKLATYPTVCQYLDLSLYSEFLNSNDVLLFCGRAPCLKYLNLSFCGQTLRNNILDNFSFPNLGIFILKECPEITAETISRLLRDCNLLKIVDFRRSLSAMNDDILEILSKQAFLETLKIEQGFDITWIGVKNVVDSCKKLKHLEIINCPYVDVQWLKPIQALPWTINESMSFKNMDYFALKHLNVSRCRSIDDEFLWGISMRSPKLEFLDFSFCSLVSDDGLRFISSMPLKKISMAGCYLISDKGISFIFQSRNLQIKEWNISNCTIITDIGLECIFQFSPLLKQISVAECPGISHKSLELLCKQYQATYYANIINISDLARNDA